MTKVLATRTKKARWHEAAGWCPLCAARIRIGQRVGLIPSGWAHTRCINAHNRAGDRRQDDTEEGTP